MEEIQPRLNLKKVQIKLYMRSTKNLGSTSSSIIWLIPIFPNECVPYLMREKRLVLMSKKHALV